MFKKVISLVMICLITFSTVYMAAGISFSDTKGHWAENEIKQMAEKWVILGKQDGTFGPDEYIIKSHAFLMFSRLMGYYEEENKELIEDAKLEYTDILKNAGITEAIGEISFLLKKGVIDRGYILETLGNGKEKEHLSRQEAAFIFVKLLGDDDKVNKFALSIFDDSDLIKEEYLPYVEYVNKIGLMIGYDNLFDPNGFVTRAQIATILCRIDNIIYERSLTKVSGYINDINFDDNTVILLISNSTTEYDLSSKLEVYINNEKIEKSILKRNDKITAYIKDNEIVKMTVDNIEKTIYAKYISSQLIEDIPYISVSENNQERIYKLTDQDLIIQNKTGQNILLSDIKSNEDIELKLVNDEVVKVVSGLINYTEVGMIEEITIGKQSYISIKNLKEEINKYEIASNCEFDFDGAIGDIYDLRLGMDVKLSITNNGVEKVKVETLTNIEIISGTIQKVLPKIYVFTIKNDEGQVLMIFLDEDETLIKTQNGVGKTIDDIKQNDQVSVYGRYEGEVFYPIQVIIH